MILSDEQNEVLESIKSGKHKITLVRGQAGSGKSVIIRAVQDAVQGTLTVSSKGLAASHIGGMTIHKAFGIPFGEAPNPDERNVGRIRYKYPSTRFFKSDHLRECQLLILDECFDIRCDVFDFIDKACRSARKRPLEPFGGLRVLMVGDEGQSLPIISDDEERLKEYGYVFPHGIEQSRVWNEL